MPMHIPERVSPFEPLGGLQLIRINPADASFFILLILLWVELGYRLFWKAPGYLPEPTMVSTVCATIRFILSAATNLGVNIVKNMELGHDISIFHRVTVPPNDCESFGFTAIFAMVFFSLRRFITQGVIFLIVPAFDYYMCLWMHLLVAALDEFMFPFSYVAQLKEHRRQVILATIFKAEAQIAAPLPTPPPSSIRSITGQKPTLLFSSGSNPTPAKKKQNAVVHQNKVSPNSDPWSSRLRSSTISSPRPRIDESPLNREELELYTLVACSHSARTIQSQTPWRVLFRLNIPLHLQELEARQKAAAAQNTLRASLHTIKQSSSMSKAASAPDAMSQSTSVKNEKSTPAPTPHPAPPIKASDRGKGRATTSSLETHKSSVMSSNPVLVSSAPKVPPGVPKSTSPVVTTPAVAPPQAPTAPLIASNKGKGKAATSNLFIPSKTVANKSTPSISAPKVPSRLSSSTLPVSSSPPVSYSSVPISAPIPHVAPPQPNTTTPAVFSPAPSVTPRHQVPDYAVDADGDCVMVDVFEEPWRSVQLSLGPVAPVETLFEMEVIPDPTEPELMETTPTVPNDESYQASMDAEPSQVYSVVCPQEAGMVVPGDPFDGLERYMSPEEICDFMESVLGIGEAPAAEQAHEAPIDGSKMPAEVSMYLPMAQQAQAVALGANMNEAVGLAPPPVNVQPAALLPYAIPTNVPFVLTPARPILSNPRIRSVIPAVVIDEDTIRANMAKAVAPPTNQEQALDKGKGKAVTPNLFIPSEPAGNNSSSSISSSPTIASSPPKSTPLVATTSVVAPQAPAPPPTVLNKGKGKAATSNLFIPRKTVATPSTSTPKVPSRLSISTVPVASSPPAPSSSFCSNPWDKE